MALFDVKPSKIFKSKEALSPHYLPDKLPMRDKELQELAWYLKDALSGSTPSNIFIYGESGVGKTACCKKVLQELKKKAEELEKSNIRTHYINCSQYKSESRILVEIANYFATRETAPKFGWAMSDYYSFFATTLDTLGGIFIIVLDEVDHLFPEREELLYHLTGAREHLLTKADISIIGITNNVSFWKTLDSRIKSRLCQRELIINPYNAKQLQAILNQRVELAFHGGVIKDGVISLCAALAAREHGDARKAIDLLRAAGEVAEKKGEKIVVEEDVRKADTLIDINAAASLIRGYPFHQKLLLATIFLQVSTTSHPIYTSTVYESYRKACAKLSAESLSERRLRGLLSKMETSGIITTKERALGRGKGKTREIEIALPYETIESAVFEDESLAPLKNYEQRKWR